MRTNGAFDRARPGDRLRSRWYGMSRAARVNKLLFLAAGVSLVAFVNVANRGSDPSTGLSAGRANRTPLSMAGPSSTDLQAAALPTGEAPLPPPVASTTTSTTSRPLTTAPATTTAAPRRAPSTTTGNPGAVDRAPSTAVAPTTAPPTTAPPTTGAPATTTAAAPTTTAPTTTAAPPPSSSTTTTTTGRSVLQILFGG